MSDPITSSTWVFDGNNRGQERESYSSDDIIELTTTPIMTFAHLAPPIEGRHIQNFSEGGTLEPHWGYADRIVPCTNDAGSCEYLDVVYSAHDRGMLYIGVFWATILGILLLWAVVSRTRRSDEGRRRVFTPASYVGRLYAGISTSKHRWFLPDAPRALFGRTTRMQVFILLILVGYLAVYSFVGISYKKWVTPVKNKPGVYNTRTSLGPWSDRIGLLAYGLLPLSVLLSSRESILTLLTGVPYHHFNFLHRWVGYVILLQSILHTIGWTIIEARLYQPQPSVAVQWIKQPYMVWGCVAILLLLLMWILTFPLVIRRTGYEFFRKAHYVLAMLFIGACWGHWANLKCFLIPSLAIWGIDRAARLVRTFLLHYNIIARPDGTSWAGFRATTAHVKVFADSINGDVVRIDLIQQQTAPWSVGQHYFITFSDFSIWQSHPFTPLSFPFVRADGTCKHSYVFRAKSGETQKVAKTVASQEEKSTSVILTGPYGENLVERIGADDNILCIAGGSGITFVLPVLTYLCSRERVNGKTDRTVALVWIVRHASDVDWVRAELDVLVASGVVSVSIHSTRDGQETSALPLDKEVRASESSSCEKEGTATTLNATSLDATSHKSRPDLSPILDTFLYKTALGPTTVFASGPGGMTSDLRDIVARNNDVKRAMRGDQGAIVRLFTDERLEW